jgi:hypothetical protein
VVAATAPIHGGTRYLEPILQTALDGPRPPGDAEAAQDNRGRTGAAAACAAHRNRIPGTFSPGGRPSRGVMVGR